MKCNILEMTYNCRRGVSCEGSPWWPPQPWWCTGNLLWQTHWCSPCWADWLLHKLLNWVEYTWKNMGKEVLQSIKVCCVYLWSWSFFKSEILSFYWPVLWHGDEEPRQLAQDDHAGVDEDAAQDRHSYQTGWGSAGVQFLAGASPPHHDGQHRHHKNVTDQELQVCHARLHLDTHINRSHVSMRVEKKN